MNELFVKYSARLDALETKERVLLTVAGALVITMIWFSVGIDPLDAERSASRRGPGQRRRFRLHRRHSLMNHPLWRNDMAHARARPPPS